MSVHLFVYLSVCLCLRTSDLSLLSDGIDKHELHSYSILYQIHFLSMIVVAVSGPTCHIMVETHNQKSHAPI